MKELKVFNPVAKSISQYFKPADRLTDLRNKTVGLVWNAKGGGDIALQRIADNLKKNLGYEFHIKEFRDDFPFAIDTIENIANSCDVAIGSTGD
jgi:hypothetical protein